SDLSCRRLRRRLRCLQSSGRLLGLLSGRIECTCACSQQSLQICRGGGELFVFCISLCSGLRLRHRLGQRGHHLLERADLLLGGRLHGGLFVDRLFRSSSGGIGRVNLLLQRGDLFGGFGGV